MAARLEGFTTTTAVFGGNRVVKVREWHCYSEPSDTYFEVRARLETARSAVQGIANGFSDTIEALLDSPDVTDIAWSQDVTAGGQLQSVFTVYWYLPEKASTGFVEVPAGQFNIDHVAALILQDSGPGVFLFAP